MMSSDDQGKMDLEWELGGSYGLAFVTYLTPRESGICYQGLSNLFSTLIHTVIKPIHIVFSLVLTLLSNLLVIHDGLLTL